MSLHADLAEDLRRQIASGELAVGQKLPSESELCATWQASRGTVRRALASLRVEGVIAGGQGARPVVVMSRAVPQSFDSFMSFTVWARRTGRVPGQKLIEIARVFPTIDVAEGLGLPPGEQVVRLLRLRYLDGDPAMLERGNFPLRAGLPLLTADLDTHSVYDTLLQAGVVPRSADHVIDAVAADEVDAGHLDVPLGSPLLRERRHAMTGSGESVELSDDRYRPDLVSFTVTNAPESTPALRRTSTSGARTIPGDVR